MSKRRAALAGCLVVASLAVTSQLVAGSLTPWRGKTSDAPATAPAVAPAPADRRPPTVALAALAPLTDAEVGLRDGPVVVPLELQMPSLSVTASVLGVGITPKAVMDAPMGPAEDPVWQQAFWYRGSAVPGTLSTALIAGHVNDPLGRPAVFAHIDGLRPGDPIIVRDTRSGLKIRFAVTGSMTYSLAEASEPAVLRQIYGAGPVMGTEPQPSADGLSHLTLVTCAGTFKNGTHDHRLAVYATRFG